ncbi:MAG: hypothetical protein ACO3Y3_02675 [Phycisphaerales bacterium]
MNRLLFAPLAILLVVLDASFMPVFRIGDVWPQWTPALVVFVAMWAPRPTVLWAAFLAGLLRDLSRPEVAANLDAIRVIGPDALGWLFGATFVLAVRRSLLRRHPAAVGAATFAFLVLASLAWGAIWAIRGVLPGSLEPWPPGGAMSAVGERIVADAYSGVAAIPLAWMLARLRPWWGFPGAAWAVPAGSRRF